MKNIKFLPPTLFFLCICGVILLVDLKGTQYVLAMVPKVKYGDKLGHFGLYGLLALLTNYSTDFKSLKIRSILIPWGSVAVLVFAILEEFTQLLLKTRSFDLLDIAADIMGIWFLPFLYTRFRRKWSKV